MKFANFYPGPSRVYANITEYMYEAYMEGILSINHRSEEFMSLLSTTKQVLRQKLQIPGDYEIIFTSSATECWEIIAQSLIQKKSQHFFNGAFGEKWAAYTGKIRSTIKTHFGINDVLPTGEVKKADLYAVTQNETSNGTQVSMETLGLLKSEVDGLIAVDATSSLGGVCLDYTLADVWYGSVQKCLGLPAGMGIMVLSPMAINVAGMIGENDHYNSLLRLLENASKDQTSYTPNVLGIYLLKRTQETSKGIVATQQKLAERYSLYEEWLGGVDQVSFLVDNESVRSLTVLTLKTSDPVSIKQLAYDRGIILGNGYGPWKSSTFRVANFPAIKTKEIEKLGEFLTRQF